MNVHSNVHLEPEKVMHCFGTRTLVIANNTSQEGMGFKNISTTMQRKGYTTSFAINDLETGEITTDTTIGLYFGKDAEPISNVAFQGRTNRQGDEFNLIVCNMGGVVKDCGLKWKLFESGWKAQGHYEMQILVVNGNQEDEWKSVKPSGWNKKPYWFESTEDAWYRLNACYPDLNERRKKIVFVAE